MRAVVLANNPQMHREAARGLEADLILVDEAATAGLARAVAAHLRPGDVLGLTGGLGTGKSVFARALIEARLAALGRAEAVPSPSFTLVQTYDLETVELWHADLYRLDTLDEIFELGLEDAFGSTICLVEWADRLAECRMWPARSLGIDLNFEPGNETARRARLTARGGGWDWLADMLAEIVPV